MNFSVFIGGIKQTKANKTISFETFLKTIKSDYYKNKISELRKHEAKSEQNAKLKNALDYVTLRGEFIYRDSSKKSFLSISNLIDIDIDFGKITEEVYNKIQGDEFVFSAFRTPNKGYKIIFKIDVENNFEDAFKKIPSYYESISIYLSNKYNFDFSAIDRCLDLSRACFVSYDPEMYYNPASLTFGKSQLEIYQDRKFKDVKVTAKDINQNQNSFDVYSFCELILEKKRFVFYRRQKIKF